MTSHARGVYSCYPYKYEVTNVCMVIYKADALSGQWVKHNVIPIAQAKARYADVLDALAGGAGLALDGLRL